MSHALIYILAAAALFAGGYLYGRPYTVAAAEARLQKLRDKVKAAVKR